MNRFIALFSVKRMLESRSISTKLTADGKTIPKKKVFENRITLISPDDSVSITDLGSAQSLSARRDLKLVKIQDVDAKTRRPVYKLMTNTDYHAEELAKRKEKQEARLNSAIKGEKLLTLSSKIGDHDLMTGIKKMSKLLDKQYEVKVIISGEGAEADVNTERIYSIIEKHIKSAGKLVQKRNKGNTLRFQLMPVKSNDSQSSTSSTQLDSSPNGRDKGPL